MMTGARAVATRLEVLEGELAATLGIADPEARLSALRRSEREALDLVAVASGLGEMVSVAVALRLSALSGLYQRQWRSPLSQMSRRLRLAGQLLRRLPTQNLAPEHAFELAKIETARASILDETYRLRSLRGVNAAHRLFGEAEALFRAVGAAEQAIRQRANMAQVMFCAGTLGDLAAYETSAADFAAARDAGDAAISPDQRAIWSGYRGSALGALAESGRPEFYEPAQQAMRDALAALEASPRSRDVAMICLNLAGLLMHSRRGQWRTDIEESIALLHRARDRTGDDPTLASALDYTLCAAYVFSPGGTLTDNIERAIAFGAHGYNAIDAALAPVDKAKAAENLAMAYALRIRGDRADNFARAMQLTEEAVRLTSRTRNPVTWSDRQGNAGTILLYHGADDPRRYAGAYLRFCRALRARPLSARSSGPAAIIMLKAALSRMALHEHRPRRSLLGGAARHARNAVAAFAGDADSEGRRRALVVEADCAAAGGNWQSAMDLLEQARALQAPEPDRQRDQWVTFATTTRSLGSYAHMHGSAAYCAVRIGRPDYALELLESAKANALAQALGLAGDGAKAPVTLTAPTEDVVALAPVFHREGAAVLIAGLGAGRPEIIDIVHLEGVTRNTLVDVLHLGSSSRPPFSQALHDDDADSIARAIEAVAAWQWQRIVAPVVASLDRHLGSATPRLVLSPHAGSGALPWHAAGPEVSEPGPLWSRWRLSYLPSLRLLPTAARWGARAAKIVTIADPTGDLEECEAECRRIGSLAGGRHVHFGSLDAAPDAIIAACSDAGAIHFSGHASYDPFAPQSSRFHLGEDADLTVADIARRMRLTGSPLVTLAACESGVADYTERSDEFLGMPAAFLAAGAGCVVASQWKVSSKASTAMFVELYRRIHRMGEAPADAVVATAQWLSALSPDAARAGGEGWSFDEASIADAADISGAPDRPFSHPFYWAPFVAIGRGW